MNATSLKHSMTATQHTAGKIMVSSFCLLMEGIQAEANECEGN